MAPQCGIGDWENSSSKALDPYCQIRKDTPMFRFIIFCYNADYYDGLFLGQGLNGLCHARK